MSKVADYLKDHISGDVSVAAAKRQHFAGDASALRQFPQIIVSPVDEQDIRKITRFAWQLAERGRIMPIVARGAGSDLSGAAIGQVIVLAVEPYLNKVLEFDDKHRCVTVEPGANFGKLQHSLTFSHGSYIPAYPSSLAYSTIGGAIANNSSGERSLRNGTMTNFVESLRIVLANGDVIDTKRITKKEANRKMGLSTFEGEIYRAIDGLLSENQGAIEASVLPSRGGVGYNLKLIRADNGSVDLTPLLVGSQGTLGVIVQAVIRVEAYKPKASQVIFVLSDRSILSALTAELLKDKTLNLEFVDASMLDLARREHQNLLPGEDDGGVPAGILLAEFEDMSKRALDKLVKKYYKKFADSGVVLVEQGDGTVALTEKIKRLPGVLLSEQFGAMRLVPGIDDAMVPVNTLHEFMLSAEQLFKKLNISVVIHARTGEGIIHAYPLVDLSQLGDRQKLLRLTADYYKLVLEYGGSVVGEHGAGRTRGSFARTQLGDVVYELMHRVKQIFDPYGILNPGVKVDVDPKANLGLLSSDFEITQLYHH